MGVKDRENEVVANRLVRDTLKAAVDKTHLSSEEDADLGGTNGHGVTFDIREHADVDDDEVIEEDIIDGREDDLNKTRVMKGNDDFDDTISSASTRSGSSTSGSSTSSYSSGSALNQTKPPRLAQTFKVGDLTNELNKTRTLSQQRRSDSSPRVTSAKVSKQNSSPRFKQNRVNSWIDPKSIKGTENDAKKIETWISEKDQEKKKQLKEERRLKKDKLKKEIEEREEKEMLEKKNFELWENKKKVLLEQKIKKSEEMKKRKEEKEKDKIEKLKVNEKQFQSWKSKKEEHLKKDRSERRRNEKENRDEAERLKGEKERMASNGFVKWCQRQKDLEEKQKAAQQAVHEAEDELKLLEEYRRYEAEEEYMKWKKEKRLCPSPEMKQVEHPLGWAPAGKSDGKNRRSTEIKPASPGEPLSKTLASLKGSPNYHRRLKTVDVCCRQISFWCHCPPDQTPENGHHHLHDKSHDETFQRSFSHPVRSSTPNHSPGSSRPDISRHLSENGGTGQEYGGLSRHTTPNNSRPSTARSSRPSSARSSRPSTARTSRASTPRRY